MSLATAAAGAGAGFLVGGPIGAVVGAVAGGVVGGTKPAPTASSDWQSSGGIVGPSTVNQGCPEGYVRAPWRGGIAPPIFWKGACITRAEAEAIANGPQMSDYGDIGAVPLWLIMVGLGTAAYVYWRR